MRRQLRSFFEMLFGRPKPDPGTRVYLQTLSGLSPSLSPRTMIDAYDYDVVRAAVDAIARNAAKLKPRHIRRVGDEVHHVRSSIERLLAYKPNPYMDAYSFYYKVVTTWLLRNNAFIYPHRDEVTGEVSGFYPVVASSVELLEAPDKVMYVRFRFGSGEQLTVPYDEIIHLRRFFYRHDIYGDDNKALTPTLDLIRTTDEGIATAVKSSAHIRGILKFTAMLKPEDIKEERDRFVREYLDISNNGGVAATDAKAEYIPLESKPIVVDAKQMEAIKDKVYSYFGVNEAIIKSRYREDEWNAFYESVLEPLAVQMSLAFTNALFSPREIGHGNEIIFEANRLQYASARTKLALVAMVDRGAMTPNEWRAVMNLAPIDGGDEPIRRLDTAVVAPSLTDYDEGSDEDDGADDSDAGSDAEGS